MPSLTAPKARTEGAIATLSEALENATGVMLLDITECLGDDGEPDMKRIRELPPIQRRALSIEVQTTTDEDGQVFARHKLKRDSVAIARGSNDRAALRRAGHARSGCGRGRPAQRRCRRCRSRRSRR